MMNTCYCFSPNLKSRSSIETGSLKFDSYFVVQTHLKLSQLITIYFHFSEVS